MRLGAMTGLRPIEWYGSYLASEVMVPGVDEPYKNVLIVKSSEKGNRENTLASYRYLSVEHWKAQEINLLIQMLGTMQSLRNNADAYLHALDEDANVAVDDSLIGKMINKGSGGDIELSGVVAGAAHGKALYASSVGDEYASDSFMAGSFDS